MGGLKSLKNCSKKYLVAVFALACITAPLQAKTFKEKISNVALVLCKALATTSCINATAIVPFLLIEPGIPVAAKTLEAYSILPLLYSAYKINAEKKTTPPEDRTQKKEPTPMVIRGKLFLSLFHVSSAIAAAICAISHIKETKADPWSWPEYKNNYIAEWNDFLKNDSKTILDGVRNPSWPERLMNNLITASKRDRASSADTLFHSAALFHHLVTIPALLDTAYELYQSALPFRKKPKNTEKNQQESDPREKPTSTSESSEQVNKE